MVCVSEAPSGRCEGSRAGVQAAQKLAPLLSLLRNQLGLQVTLFMNPVLELSDLPLKSYYRYVVPQFVETDDGEPPRFGCIHTSPCDIFDRATLLAWFHAGVGCCQQSWPMLGVQGAVALRGPRRRCSRRCRGRRC